MNKDFKFDSEKLVCFILYFHVLSKKCCKIIRTTEFVGTYFSIHFVQKKTWDSRFWSFNFYIDIAKKERIKRENLEEYHEEVAEAQEEKKVGFILICNWQNSGEISITETH